jgi:hypothetical protein
VTKISEILAVNKQRSKRIHMERSEDQLHVEISDRFAALEDWDAEVGINSV